MRRSALLGLLGLTTVLVGCSKQAESPRLSVAYIAASWSGGRTDPVCSNRGPRGEYLGRTPGAEHCQWPTVTRGTEFGTVSATRDSINGWTSITWERVFKDTAGVTTMLDSLDRAFVAAGLLAHRCVGGGRRWQAPGLAVQSMPPVQRPAGGVLVSVIAVENAVAIPSLFCPDAPPQSPDPTRRSGAT